MNGIRGNVFNIQRFSIQDGPGIRTTVFLKGCPLRCLWCSNPESINPWPEVSHRDSLCDGCGKCLDVCEAKALSVSGKKVTIDRQKCNNCGKCVEACYTGALGLLGKNMTAEEVVAEVVRDQGYYITSGGGMTVSGGEPLEQPAFVIELFKQCHKKGIPTAMETTGFTKPDILKEVIANVDLVLYDLKSLDTNVSEKFTGMPNQLILQNISIVARRGIPIIFRIPLVSGVNDSEDNIRASAELAASYGQKEVDLLPYHKYGAGKYSMLDRKYGGEGLQAPSEERVKHLKQIIESYGLKCNLGG